MIELYFPIFHIGFCERFDKTDLLKATFRKNLEVLGYGGEWYNYKLGDLDDFRNGANFSKEDYTSGLSIVNVKQLYRGRYVDTTGLLQIRVGAVANAIPELKDLADFVSKKPYGEGVMEFIEFIKGARTVGTQKLKNDRDIYSCW